MSAESKHVTAFRQKHLKPGEAIQAWVEGYIGEMMGTGKNTQHNGALVVTNARVAFYRKGLLGEVLEAIPLPKLTSVERKSLLGHNTLRLHTSHDDLTFKAFDKARLEVAIEAIEKGRDDTTTASNASTLASSDPLEQIKKLGQLRDAGVLTPEEFEAKKRDLLARL
jgi:hypothetical protein